MRAQPIWSPLLGATPSKGDPISVAIWVGALILVVVLAGLAVMAIRRRILAKPQDATTVAGSWLDELRAMHRRGEIDDEEFQAARASLLAKVSGTPMPKRPPGAGTLVARPGFDLTGAPLPPAPPPQAAQDPPTRDPLPRPESFEDPGPDRPPTAHE